MKTLLPLILAFLFCLTTGQAQDFARKDSKWVYISYGWHTATYYEISFDKETIYKGEQCLQFKSEYIQIDELTGDTSYGNSSDYLFLSEEDGLVQFYFPYYFESTWDTLFDFNGTIGETWTIEFGFFNPTEKMIISLQDTFSTQINGHRIKALALGYARPPANNGYILDTVFQYIGNKNLFIVPGTRWSNGGDLSFGGPVKCFYNEILGSVEMLDVNIPGYDYDCDQLVSVKEPAPNKNLLSLSPNPVHDQVQLITFGDKIELVEIFDLLGNIMHSAKIPGSTEIILELPHLTKGVYIVRVNGQTGGKFLKM